MVAGYASAYEIVQAPDTVALTVEMIHDPRVIPLGAPAHLPATFRRWHGDSRGHWQGDTLVVDTINYKPGAFMRDLERVSSTSWNGSPGANRTS